jgi:hypothetical protein
MTYCRGNGSDIIDCVLDLSLARNTGHDVRWIESLVVWRRQVIPRRPIGPKPPLLQELGHTRG